MAYPKKKHTNSYKSGLEVTVAKALADLGITDCYEKFKIEWKDLMYRKYTPDFILPNGVIIETKGLFTASDRRKHLEIKAQHPTLDIRFVFSRSASKLSKKSKTTYAKWCDKNGFIYADKAIPWEWHKGKDKPPPNELITVENDYGL